MNIQKLQLTTEEAKKLIRNAPNGASFNLHIRIDLPIADQPDMLFRNGGSSYVKLSRADALRIVSNLMNEVLEARGARIPISHDVDERLAFDMKKREHVEKVRHVYWIG